jgi:predicted nucleic acid-binding protein
VIYIDTNVIISAIDELDSLHKEAVELLNKFKDYGEKITSKLTLVELVSVYSRAGLEKPFIYALASIKSLGIRIYTEIDFNTILDRAVRYSKDLKLKTLDLLHIVAAITIGAKYFVTFDKDIIGKRYFIERHGLKILTI